MTGHTKKGGDRRYRRRDRTRRHVPWDGWRFEAPNTRERRTMERDCYPYSKCFLGPDRSFPVCKKDTCEVSSKGLWAAYIRAKEWGKPARTYKGKARPRYERKVYQRTARNAKRRLERRGFKVGK